MSSKAKVIDLCLVKAGVGRGWGIKRSIREAVIYPPIKRKIPVIRRKKVAVKTAQAQKAGAPKAS